MLKLTPELMEKIDAQTPSPSALASVVYNIWKEKHPELTDYEIACFCVEFLGALSLGEFSFMQPEVKKLLAIFYQAHYERFEWHTSGQASIKKEDGINPILPTTSSDSSSTTESSETK